MLLYCTVSINYEIIFLMFVNILLISICFSVLEVECKPIKENPGKLNKRTPHKKHNTVTSNAKIPSHIIHSLKVN